MKSKVNEIAVVHLVRAGNDVAAVKRFVASYMGHLAGFDHNLIFLLKGFSGALPADLDAILNRVTHTRMHCPDHGYDIGSYFYATARIVQQHVLLLNSFSIICADDWLSKFAAAYALPGVGLVGATGSWESIASTLQHCTDSGVSSSAPGLYRRMKAWLTGSALRTLFPRFPNPHIRTNAFMVARQDFLSTKPMVIRFKIQAWLFESGRVSLTRKLMRRGLCTVIVGRDGVAYDIQRWHQSRIFWQHDQGNIMIHDNRTIAYSQASPPVRDRLSRAAWNCRRI